MSIEKKILEINMKLCRAPDVQKDLPTWHAHLVVHMDLMLNRGFHCHNDQTFDTNFLPNSKKDFDLTFKYHIKTIEKYLKRL